MLSPLKDTTYRRLFLAQVIALVGTGLATVALGLLAYQLARPSAGMVLGTALAIKMVAYVGVAPVAGALATVLPRRPFLIVLDIVRGLIALALPFVDQVWQIYLLIFLLQASSAAFTPTFQATIPNILPDEREYTKALSLSRLAYDLENIVSPMLAAALLLVVSFHWLFAGTVIGFAVSALLVWSVVLPRLTSDRPQGSFFDRTTRGVRYYLATPRLRGLLALNMAAAAGGAMVIVNTVVYVRTFLGGTDVDVAVALAVYGGGSMVAALLLPGLLERIPDRTVMLTGALTMLGSLVAAGMLTGSSSAPWLVLYGAWLMLGLSSSTVLTPVGRLLRRSCHEEDRPALFAAQFALSHACWLVTYPLAGWVGASFGMSAAILALAMIAAGSIVLALLVWPSNDPEVISHHHHDLPDGHPHLDGATPTDQGRRHAHPYVIDEHHRSWPTGS